jgi:carbamoylphosphate synthase large subunit
MPKIANLIIEMHLLLFLIFLFLAALLGFIIAKRKQVSLNKRILDVEEEMLLANKEVLRYAEENKQLAEALEKAKIPIPSITKHKEEEEKLRSIPLEKIG